MYSLKTSSLREAVVTYELIGFNTRTGAEYVYATVTSKAEARKLVAVARRAGNALRIVQKGEEAPLKESVTTMRALLSLAEGKSAKLLDPFVDLEKRHRLALRTALMDADGTASAPPAIVTKLEKLGLVIRTGHNYEPQEWGKVVRSEPLFYLTAEGTKVAEAIKAKLGAS
jgi:hypothetical protein